VTLQFGALRAERAEISPLFVLVIQGRERRRPRLSLADSRLAGTVAHCRRALAHARDHSIPLAFVADGGKARNAVIKGLEPRGRDMLFMRNSVSCYESRYFAEAAKAHRTIVAAGFLDCAGCIALASDAMRAGQRVLFLRDAIAGPMPAGFDTRQSDSRMNGIRVEDTAAWIADSCNLHRAIRKTTSPIIFPPTNDPQGIM
jgi:Isochorismatase family